MEYIAKLYGVKFLEKQKKLLTSMYEPSGVAYFLLGEDDGARLRLVEFNKYLELAFRYNIVNKDLKKRLSSQNWHTFYQAKNELMCACFIEKEFRYNISFHPMGTGKSIGDFNIEYSEIGNIFVEVKSPIREIQNPVWSGYDSKAIKRNIVTARKQMPDDNENLVMFTGDLRARISHEQPFIGSLYGESILTFPVGKGVSAEEPKWSINPSGLFQPNANTRISAVATLEDCIGYPPEKVVYTYKVYHNPYAKKPINCDIFKSCPQFVLNKEKNIMEWIGKGELNENK